MAKWRFFIDVGGTFTDVIACDPQGCWHSHKTLSSGLIKGTIDQVHGQRMISSTRIGDSNGIWQGYTLSVLSTAGKVLEHAQVQDSDSTTGQLILDHSLPASLQGLAYELNGYEPAPVVSIRYLLGLSRSHSIPPVILKLGTTRGTNALLERKGARCGYVTTAGFRDTLKIGYQDRPHLFKLNIERPASLAAETIEIQERISAQGEVLTELDEDDTRLQLQRIKSTGVEVLAIHLLNAYQNPAHELRVAQLAAEAGFQSISCSHEISPLIGFIARGDTTLVDAYLTPLLQEYLTLITSALPGSEIQLMTSQGGLVPAGFFRGNDSILSGPAGGVVAMAELSRLHGIRQSIGFDMGGTSTDVCRFGGELVRQYETLKAGVRINWPMLSIETVAAGGGSICRFDGVRLLVGPESAGAHPGPCCYGNDGPLTITDMNVITGRLLTDHFPFRLNLVAVRNQLEEMRQDIIRSGLYGELTLEQLAESFLDIANIRMARAIRNVSAEKGYHCPEHELITFGGAGGQHACALASELNIEKILVPRHASLLSAWGIGRARPCRIESRSVLQQADSFPPQELEAAFAELHTLARKHLLNQGVSASEALTEKRSLDLRYLRTETSLTIPEPSDGNYVSAFHAEFLRRFGYQRQDYAIEIVTARLELTAETLRDEQADSFPKPHPHEEAVNLQPLEIRQVYYRGSWISVTVLTPAQLSQTEACKGPLLICQPHSTVFLPPDFSAVGLEGDGLRLTRNVSTETPTFPAEQQRTAATLLETFHQQFASIAEQMGETLRQTAQSVNVKERLDYSCAVFDASGSLIANAPHVPVHLGAMSETVRCLLEEFPIMEPGDAYITNDPFRGGSHLPDITVITPMFSSDRQLRFLVASRAHHADVGGLTPGSMPPFSKNLEEEGVLIRSRKLVSARTDHLNDVTEILRSSRWPARRIVENLADLRAQLAANQLGISLLTDQISQYGYELVHHYVGKIREASAEKTRQAFSRLNFSQATFSDRLDDGSPIVVKIEREGDHIRIDFTGTGPVSKSNLNANRAIVQAAVIYVLRCLIDEDVPMNAGLLDPVELNIPPSLLNPPGASTPAESPAMVGGNVETSQRLVDVLLGAFQLAAASQGTMNNLTFGNPEFGYYETICGGSGATPQGNGCDAVHTHMTNTRLTDPEILEHRFPVRVIRHQIRTGSGGSGKHRGGNGLARELEFLVPLSVSLLAQRRGTDPPFGLKGGKPGLTGESWLIRKESTICEHLPGSFTLELQPGDRLLLKTPGGGGWGVE